MDNRSRFTLALETDEETDDGATREFWPSDAVAGTPADNSIEDVCSDGVVLSAVVPLTFSTISAKSGASRHIRSNVDNPATSEHEGDNASPSPGVDSSALKEE